jgi:hypothetical protein
MYKNKGIYGHIGGISHSYLILWNYAPDFVYLALIDGIVHYHIDWAKVKINSQFSLTATNSETFWYLLGFDQLLHAYTYLGMVSYVLS